MKSLRLLVCAVALVAVAASASPLSNIEPKFVAGRKLANVRLIDDAGRTRSMAELNGKPMIFVPMYTKCQSTCLRVASNLKRALLDSRLDVQQYRVVLFSFDASDTPQDLAAFRKREAIPLVWTIATASTADIDQLMESISFRYANAGGQFVHPNLIIAVTPQLTTAKYLFGTRYSARDLEDALRIARGGRDWMQFALQYGFAVLMLLCTLALVYLVYLVTKLRDLRRTAAANV